MLAAVIALHGVVLALLMQPSQPPQAQTPPAVLAAAIIQEQAVQSATPASQPRVITPPPARKVATLTPPLTTTAETAVTTAAAETEPPVEPAAAEAADTMAAPFVPAEAPTTQPGPIQGPSFDADYLDNPAPAYPSLSRRLREEGIVLLRVYVDAGGSPAQLELKQSSGHDRLDRAALETVRHWRFVPARQDGEAVAGWVVVPISFTLRS
ncbi:MAG: energy transducer TonB [Pseudomonadota bacterium]